MHQQYRKHVGIGQIDQYEYIYFVTWTDYKSSDKRCICVVDGNLEYLKNYVFTFTREPNWEEYKWWLLVVPRNYFYSSGLNDPSGYK
jgi:hypothetical protein